VENGIAKDLDIPKPYGAFSPFKPPENYDHIKRCTKKPTTKPVEI
jgi:hypothetical protein